MRSRLLVTGFGSFRDIDDNPSGWLAERLRTEQIPAFAGMTSQVLEVSYAAVDEFVAGLDADDFDAWLMMGVHGNAGRMHLETVAKNSCGPGADVRGVVAGPGCIDPSLPPQVVGSLFTDSLESEKAVLTVDAGGYLCNYLFFRGVTAFPDKRIGFLHVPRVEVMGLEDQLGEVRRILGELSD